MNDQSNLMNHPPPQHMLGQPPLPPRMNPLNPPQSRIMNQPPLLGQSHPIMVMNQQPPPQIMMNNNNNSQPLMMNQFNFNQNQPNNNFGSKMNRNNNWKGKNNDKRRMPNYNPGSSSSYKPPALNELQSQNRAKTKKFYPKKKYGNNNNRYVPYAPRNTTSFIIRAKKSGGIAELVSPCPVTPAVLPTPMFSPSREVLGDMAKEEWGVDGYGSMKGLIRLRADGVEDEEDEGGSSESDVEEHVEVERRLDHDLSRFEMIYPNNYGGNEYNNVLENRVDDQDSHISQLEEENLTLKERLFLMERELGDLRRRLGYLERRNNVAEDVNEEVVENESVESEGDDTGGSDARTSGDSKVAVGDTFMQDVAVKDKRSNVDEADKGIVGITSDEADMVVVSMEQSKESDSIGEQ